MGLFKDIQKQLIRVYLNQKKQWSAWAQMYLYKQRARLPICVSIPDVWDVVSKLKYTGDPLYGITDFTQHPEYLYWCVLNKSKPNFEWPPIDCDDYAELARALLVTAGFEAETAVLFDPRIKMSHVICIFQHKGRMCSIDTNGIHYWDSYAHLLRQFGIWYSANYTLIM